MVIEQFFLNKFSEGTQVATEMSPREMQWFDKPSQLGIVGLQHNIVHSMTPKPLYSYNHSLSDATLALLQDVCTHTTTENTL